MGLFGNRKKTPADARADEPATECPHRSLVARWDSVAQMGSQEQISGYVCEICRQTFSREVGERLIEKQDERLRRLAL